MKSSIPFLLLPFVCVHFAQAQAVKEPKFQSPNAASLGKFGDTPVSHHTGIAEISVPIFTVQEGELSVPISLNYHSSGFKLEDVSSWVGLYWDLAAGGSITRTVVGGPDEGKSQTSGMYSNCGSRGWFKDYGIPDCLELSSQGCGSPNPAYGKGSGVPDCCWRVYMDAAKGHIDSEPDLYSFSLPEGHSSKFFFDENRKPHMTPEKDYFIEPEEEPNIFQTWKIIAPDGTKYYFGGPDATENSYTGLNFTSPSEDNKSSTTWYLTKIESMNGDRWIQFEYESEQSSYGTKSTHTYIRAGGMGTQGALSPCPIFTVVNTDGKRLSRITTSSGYTTVDFIEASTARQDLSAYVYADNANTQAKALSQIEVNYGSECKRFTFNTTYFQSTDANACIAMPNTSYDQKRLKLVSVQESVCDNSLTLPPYEFTYEESASLPRRYSFAQDHWGYYNGQVGNSVLLPSFTDPFSGSYFGLSDREPHEASMKLGVLKRLTYPLGGFTEFTYSAHKTSPSSSTIYGGLRVSSITDNDGNGNTITRNYDYIAGTFYAGQVSYAQDTDANAGLFNYAGVLEFGWILSSSSNPPLQTTQGYHIGYSVVDEIRPGIGKIRYTYTNTSPISSTFQYPKVPSIAVIGTAELSSVTYYDESGVPKRSTSYVYGADGGNVSVTGRKVTTVVCFNKNPDHPDQTHEECLLEHPAVIDYSLATYRHHLVQKTEEEDGVTTITNYTYDSNNKHNNPKSTEISNSDGAVHRTETTYPSDAGSGAPAAMYDPANADFKNLLGVATEEKELINSVLSSRSTNQFAQTGSDILLSSSRLYPTGTTDYTEDQYTYDQNSNVVNITKNDGSKTSFFWGYNEQYPVAAVQNATHQFTPKAGPTFGTTVTGNVSSCTNLSGNLTLLETQTVSFTPSVTLSGATGIWIKLTLKNSGGTIIFGPKQYDATGTYPESMVLPAGTYTFCYEAGNYPTPYTGYSAVNITTNVGFRRTIYHTSFEEIGTTDASPKTGEKVWSGTYAVTMPHVNGDYILSYWKKQNTGSPWVYQEQSITISSPTTADVVIGQAGYLIDEVRLYPVGSKMSTYTYSPGVGISSETDPNLTTSRYEYDNRGRLQLIRDDKGQILKTFQYHYKNEN